MTVSDLQPGERAVLKAPASLTPTVLRLMEMGMTPGSEVRVTRRAPLGDPIELAVRETRLCLRLTEASLFPVDRQGTTA